MFERWVQIQNSPEFLGYSPEDRMAIKRGWFTKNIEPTPEFQAYNETDRSAIVDGFLEPDAPEKAKEPFSLGTVTGGAKALGRGLIEGVTTELPGQAGRALEFLTPDVVAENIGNPGKALADWSDKKAKEWYGEADYKGLESWLYEGAKMLAPSVVPAGVFGAGARVVLGIGKLTKSARALKALGGAANLSKANALMKEADAAAKLANKVAGAGTAGIFGLAQAQSTKDTALQRADEFEKQGMLDEAIKMRETAHGLTPYITGGIEAAGEYLGTKYLGKMFGLDQAEIVKRGAGKLIKDFLKTWGVEVSTEVGQQAGEAAVEKYTAIRPEAEPLAEALSVIGPTTVMTLLTGGGGAGVGAMARQPVVQPQPSKAEVERGLINKIATATTVDDAVESFNRATKPTAPISALPLSPPITTQVQGLPIIPPAAPQEATQPQTGGIEDASGIYGNEGQVLPPEGVPMEAEAPREGITGVREEAALRQEPRAGVEDIRQPVQEQGFTERRRKEVAEVITPEHIESLKGLGYDYDDIFLMNPRDADYIIETGRKPEEIDTSQRVKGPTVKESLPVEPVAEPTPKAKEPWEMGKSEFIHEEKYPSVKDAIDSAGEVPDGYFLRIDPKVYNPKDRLPPSRKWVNEEPTNKTYKGTSVLDPRKKLTNLDLQTQYEGNVYLVKGKIIGKGQDAGEVFIKDAEVVRRIDDASNLIHKREIQQAIADGKPVPPEVLKDYPELVKKADLPSAETVTEPSEKAAPATPESKKPLFYDDNENAIVFEKGDNRISVDKPGNASKVVLWTKQEVKGREYYRKSGSLNTTIKTKKVNGEIGDYLNISEIEIEKAERGKRLGIQMYRELIANAPANVKGIISYVPNRVNKTQVPSIYKRLGAFTDGDYDIIPIKPTPEAPKVTEPVKSDTQAVGKAWIDNQQRPIYAVRNAKGKRNKGKVYVTLAMGKTAKIDESKVISWPTAPSEAAQSKPKPALPVPSKKEPNLYGTAKALLSSNIKMGEPIIAKDKVGDVEYEFRVGKFSDPSMPQMKFEIQMRRAGSGNEWESAMVGKATSKKDAMRFMVERYGRLGSDIEKLEILDDTLRGFVDDKIKSDKEKSAKAEKEKQEKDRKQQADLEEMRQMQEREPLIAKEMKKAKATKQKIKIKTGAEDDITPTEIDANVIGDFAYHKAHGAEHYSVTHIPSGFALDRELTLKDARELTYRLSFVKEKWDGKGKPSEAFRNEVTTTNKALRSRELIKPTPAEPSKPEQKEEAKAVPVNKNEPGKVEDFGEKLGGARKDLSGFVQKELTDDDISNKPLSEIWPKSQIDSIEDKDSAAIATAIRASVPSKPRTSYKLRRWVQQVKSVKELMKFAEEMGGDQLIKKMSEQTGLAGLLSKIKVLQKIERNDWKRIGDVGEHPDAYSYGKGTERIPSPYVSVEIDGKRATFKVKSISEVEDQIKERLTGEAPEKKLQFEVRGTLGKYQINKVGDPLYRPLKTFADLKEAREYRSNNNDALVLAWEQLKENENVKETDVRKKDNRPRVGADHRKGKDATPDMFMDSFGFRGVEFGNWVSQGKNIKERQGMLNAAFDALFDLANILDVPTKAISLNGELGLGLGSRGHGSASAHYEPDFIVINLTKTRGAGAIAHEFFHALDHYFHRMRGTKTNVAHGNYITYQPETYYQHEKGQKLSASRFNQLKEQRGIRESEWKRLDDKVRPEVSEAFKDLVDAINASPMSKRSSLIDKGKSGGYWSRIIERAARSFENYVIAKMSEKGYHNDYLANVTAIEGFARDPGRYPYLLADELPPIKDAFDNLFATIETKETPKGTAIFSKRQIPESTGRYKQAKLEKLINHRVKGWANAPKFEVVGKQNQLPQAILDAIQADTIVDAVLYKGTAYLVAENLGGPKHALNALFHESFGEHGLRLLENDPVIGPEYKAFESKLLETHKTAISKVAKEYNLDMSNERQASIAAKEYLSREAAKEATTGPIRRLIRLIKRWLAEIVPSLKSQRDDIRQWLRDARTAVEAGLPGEVTGEPAYSSAKMADKWFSQMTNFIEDKLSGKGTGKAYLDTVNSWAKKGMIKSEELEWSGLTQYLTDFDSHKNELIAEHEKNIKNQEQIIINAEDESNFESISRNANDIISRDRAEIRALQSGNVTKQAVVDYLAANNIQVQEVIKGIEFSKAEKKDWEYLTDKMRSFETRDKMTTKERERYDQLALKRAESEKLKFSKWQVPGGSNYRELLLTLPTKQRIAKVKTTGEPDSEIRISDESKTYRSAHWDEPNVLAHIRFNERTGPKGERILFIEELQSDWHQKGRKEGYTKGGIPEIEKTKDNDFQWSYNRPDIGPGRSLQGTITDWKGSGWAESGKPFPDGGRGFRADFQNKHTEFDNFGEAENWLKQEMSKVLSSVRLESGEVPDAPFKKTGQWSMLAIKRMIRYAAENGYDSISWTPGSVHTDRYGTERIEWQKQTDGSFLVDAQAQAGGHAAGIDLEAEATARGLNPKTSSTVSSEKELETLIAPVLTEGQDEKLLAEKLWKRMQLEDSGVSMPRKEGFEGYYDKILPAEVNKFFNKAAWGNAKVGTVEINTSMTSKQKLENVFAKEFKDSDGNIIKAHNLTITPEMKSKSLREGMPVFQTHTEERPKEPSAFEKGKDDWFGNKDWAEQQHTVEAGKLQEDIRKALGYKKKPSFVRHPRKRTAQDNHVRDVDSAIHIYLDLKRNPEHLNEYYDSLTDKQKKIADIAQTIDDNPKLKEIADHIDGEYRKIGKMSFDEGLIHNVLENYVGRAWRIDKGHSTEAFRKFGTKTRHRKHRVFETILEGQASGFELLVSGATNNLELLKNEISRTLEDKKLIDELRKTDWEDTEERIVTDTKLKGYEKIEHPNFTYWTFATKVDMKESPVDKATGLMVGDFVRAYDRDNIGYNSLFGKVTDIQGGSVTVHFINKEKGTEATKTFSDTGVGELSVKSIRKVSPKGVNFFIADDGTVLEKRDLYAPEKVAKSLNKILGTSKLKGKPGIDTLTKYNAVFKHWILVSSFFHHLAFMRSYLLGTKEKSLKEWNVNSARKAGLKAINELSPEIELLVRNGLTLGKVQDWEESILSQEDTIFGEITDKLTRSTKIKDAISGLRQRQADFLFRNFGAGLKAQAALIELRNVRKAQLKRAENGKDAVLDHNEQAKMVANLINDDFGGLHLGRLERDPTIQHIFRLFALAPDWTESNVRTMVKAVRSGGKAETRLYRKFWASVLTKGITATILANILLGVGDDKDLVEKFKDAWEEGNFRWLGVDITPIYKLLGGETEARKYFSIFGHFKDPMKFITHPIKSAHHKGSVLYRLFHESMAGTDWRGHRFTTISELFGVDDKGVYLTKSKTHKFGEPKGGKMAGKTTVYDSGKKGPIEIAQIPSYIIAQVKGAQPIQLQNLMGWMQGEIEGFDAIGRSVGANTTSTYPNRKKMMKEFVDTYVSLKGQGKRVTSLFASVKLYNKRQRARGEKEEVIPMESIVRAGNKKIGANRIQGRP